VTAKPKTTSAPELGWLIGGALMLLIMPTSLNQAGQKRRQLQDGRIH
jgi:hypothetical protein